MFGVNNPLRPADGRTKVYIAAPYELRDEAIRTLGVLEDKEYEVTSSWLRGHEGMDDEHARLDLADVARADIFFLLNPDGWQHKGGGGRHTETGYAVALGKQIVILGVRSNIFHHLSDVRVIEKLEDL